MSQVDLKLLCLLLVQNVPQDSFSSRPISNLPMVQKLVTLFEQQDGQALHHGLDRVHNTIASELAPATTCHALETKRWLTASGKTTNTYRSTPQNKIEQTAVSRHSVPLVDRETFSTVLNKNAVPNVSRSQTTEKQKTTETHIESIRTHASQVDRLAQRR